MVGTAVVGSVIAAGAAVSIAVAGYLRWSVYNDIDSKADAHYEDKVERLESRHEETRRLAEASYATVHGDEDRPTDTGFVVESKERWERLEAEIEHLSRSVDQLEQAQERHQHKTETILDAVADELDVDIMFRGGEEE